MTQLKARPDNKSPYRHLVFPSPDQPCRGILAGVGALVALQVAGIESSATVSVSDAQDDDNKQQR
jgi:hypothetical protein